VIEHNFRTTVARSREEVLDFLVDLRNALQWEQLPEGRKDIGRPDRKGHDFQREEGVGPARDGCRSIGTRRNAAV
jgi:hypothetical protein